ncbi:DUF1446 domain-containing protein [Phenylobacterium sp. LjRoot219]|uniref:acyclic terpene utilization AtuA family protein n=1 Tax=Phenylobacterium sp. LjRoot219 TaxID=3342283 RepID=UPI003ECEC782
MSATQEPRPVRIGGGTAFFDDSWDGHPALLRAAVDYLVYDFLAELTMASLASNAARNPDGFSPNFLRDVRPFLREILGSGTRIITNWGGLNPHGAADALRALARELGCACKVAVVDGDDLRPRLHALRAGDVREMFSGEPLPADRPISSANAYFGAFPIAAGLAAGADVVITGRVVDSALALGALIHEFDWRPDDLDRLAAGTLVGHLLECSTQVTGGTFTDWEAVADPADIGNPIAECFADGAFVLTKPADTGGLVSIGTVAEQMLYEVSDPQAYVVPDVTCDFSAVTLEPQGPDRVLVRGATGRPAPSAWKVCATYTDGWRAQVYQPIIGMRAAAKAERQAQALFERTDRILRERNISPLKAAHVEVIGAETSYGPRSRARDAREVVAMMSVDHDQAEGVQVFLKEQVCAISAMAPGTALGLAGNLGRGVTPLMKVFNFLLPRAVAAPRLLVDGREVALGPADAESCDPASCVRPQEPARPTDVEPGLTVPLVALAWGRSGDKGDLFNVAAIAREPRFYPYIAAALSAEAVGDWFRHLVAEPAQPRIDRYLVPGVGALNFVVHDALGGGGSVCPRIDPIAKSMAQILLEHPIPVSRAIYAELPATLRT